MIQPYIKQIYKTYPSYWKEKLGRCKIKRNQIFSPANLNLLLCYVKLILSSIILLHFKAYRTTNMNTCVWFYLLVQVEVVYACENMKKRKTVQLCRKGSRFQQSLNSSSRGNLVHISTNSSHLFFDTHALDFQLHEF